MVASTTATSPEREALDAELLALRTQACGIAHDFGNIISAIGSNVELARSGLPAGPASATLDEIQKACARANDLVREMLCFGRPQQGERKPVALTPVVEEALALLRASLPPTIAIRQRFASDLPLIAADASQIHQVVLNLGTNAVHAMGERGGTLTVALDRVTVGASTTAPGLPPGQYLRLTVGDTGAGISPEILDRIFDPFFTTKGPLGTGLGLPMVRGIVEDHHGAIRVETDLGYGTAFRLLFPEAGRETAPLPTPAGTVLGAGQHIMCVDDEEAQLSVTGRVLEFLGYRCSRFADPHAAMQAFRTDPQAFDAVITDMSMPGMSGVDLARALLGIRPGVPVAIASAYGSDLDTTAVGEATARISKPASIPEISWALSGMLRRAA